MSPCAAIKIVPHIAWDDWWYSAGRARPFDVRQPAEQAAPETSLFHPGLHPNRRSHSDRAGVISRTPTRDQATRPRLRSAPRGREYSDPPRIGHGRRRCRTLSQPSCTVRKRRHPGGERFRRQSVELFERRKSPFSSRMARRKACDYAQSFRADGDRTAAPHHDIDLRRGARATISPPLGLGHAGRRPPMVQRATILDPLSGGRVRNRTFSAAFSRIMAGVQD